MQNKGTKILLIIVGMLLIPSSVFAAPTAADTQAYYKMEEASAPYADATPNGYDATSGDEPNQVAGILDFGQDFVRANTDDMIIPTDVLNTLTTPGEVSYSVWIRGTDTNLNQIIAAFAGSGGINFYIDNGYVTVGGAHCSGTPGWSNSGIGSTINDGDWHHIVIAYSGLNSQTVYIDGVLAGTASNDYCTAGATSIKFGSNPAPSGHPSQWSDYDMDETMIYDGILSASDVTYLYNSGAPGTPQQYPFSSGGGGAGNGSISNVIGSIPNFNFNLTYDNATDVFNYSYNDLDGTLNESYMEIWYYNASSYSLFNTTANSTNPGVILINASTLADQNLTMRAFAYLTDYNRTFIGNAQTALVAHLMVSGPAVLNYTLYSIDEPEGVFWGMAIVTSMMLMSAYNPPVAIIMGTAAMFFMSQFGFIRISTDILMLLGIMAGILIWRLRR
jgi:hypothetical protein|tara:strand:+ start:8313 stop:9650 length:1338 start_codon:yes stop_codon:yes gene_type:complete